MVTGWIYDHHYLDDSFDYSVLKEGVETKESETEMRSKLDESHKM